MRIKIYEAEGYEADDLIGAIAAKAEQSGLHSVIVTGDRDALQLVSPLTRVRLTKKGISELDEYDAGKVWDRYGITPRQYTDFRGLTGDSSDNVPGIPGIGEKTASRQSERIRHTGRNPGSCRRTDRAYCGPGERL